ncbi:uncharacterized protein LOC124855566 [Girardinichthys multiradiatus]|uniref:uncharacterized protein LOC124855566 n=1 Tax=Girardinichthys multiradiatus TaxID=208333 RepID=UPI001FAC0A35|nr:uncharacterized protein LOC124855566 [Girardinichthys multiradiatus]
MNKTYIIISPSFPEFTEQDFFGWFHVKLVPVLASFTPEMLRGCEWDGQGCLCHTSAKTAEIADVLLEYLQDSAAVINQPDCRTGIKTDAQWIETNLGPFSPYITYSELKFFNLSLGALVNVLSPTQKAELIMDPDSGGLEDAILVKEVLTNLTESGDEEQLGQFFQVFTQILQQTNTTFILNAAVRETILNLTLNGLAPKFVSFEVEDYELWFQVYLVPVIASLHPDSLRVIPSNISCESYEAIVTGLMESLEFLPLGISMDVRASLESLQETFPDCAELDSFTCKETHVDEMLICWGVDSSQLQKTLEDNNSTSAVCNFTIIEHACTTPTNLTAGNLATLLTCSVESNKPYVVEVWQLLFHKASPVLSQALDMFATMAPTTMSSAYSNALDALGEVVVKKLTQDQLKSKDAIRSRFQMELRPFLASPSTNFLSCLGTYNFSCQTYQLVLEAFSNQSPLMDNNRKRAVFTHFIRPFLSRKDLPDPGCVSSADGSQLWLQANLGNFSAFATIEDLQTFNPNFSSAQALSELSPSQVAQLLLSSDISNDTKFIDRVFERLENGNAVDNVDEFFTKLTEQEEVPEFQADVRDRIMNKTYIIISPSFPEFTEQDFFGWFHVKLVPVLASFTPEMLRGVTTNMNCTNYHIIVSGMAKVVSAIPQQRLQEIAEVLLEYLQDSAAVINQPDCRTGIKTDAQWIETNLGPFSPYITYSELKFFNLSLGALVNVLSPTQKAELIMDPDSGGLEDAILVKEVLTNLTESGDEEQLGQFFQVFTQILQQTNTTFILNAAVRETILNLTLNGLAPKFVSFEVEDYELWFQVYLVPVIASLHPDSLRVIPSNISCESYEAIVTGLMESLEFLPLGISMDVRASLESLQETFPDCAELDSFTCKETHVDEMLICWGVDSSQLQKTLEDNNSTSAVCNFTIIEHACTTPTNLTAGNLATLLTCSVESNKPYVVEVWQLLFHKASPVLSQALDMFATMAPTTMSSAYSNALDALGEVVVKKLTQDQLKSKDAIRSRFQMELRPFLASPSTNFLSCLGTYNFSCQTYQLVLEAFSNQSPLMDNNRKRTVFTHFIRPFLSRKDLPDPGCVSSADGSQLWLQANLGNFSAFATIEDLQTFNPNFSSAQALSELSPSQVAQLLLSSDISNDTKFIDRVFERLENGNAVDNVDEFFTKLTEQEEVPEFQADVRDRIMNKTYIIISPSFPEFTEQDFFGWFHVKLVPVLASFTPEMLRGVTTNMNCTNYHIIVSGMAKVVSAIPQQRLQEIADVLLEYLQDSAAVINQPDCRTGIKTDAQWIETNLGPFSPYITYSELKFFNLSLGALVNVLSPTQKAELIMDPDSGGLEDAILVKEVLTNLTESGDEEQLGQFFQVFTQILQQTNTTFILNAAVRETILNLTLNGLAPKFVSFEVEDYELWFQVYLVPVIASLHPDSLRVIPSNISCESYEAIVTGLMESLEFLPLGISMDVRASLESLQETFPDCAELDSFTCKETHVDEMLICWGVDSSQLQKTLEDNNSTSAVCNFTIIEHACTTPTNLTAGNLATLLTCSVESNKPYVVEVWQLLFHKASPVLSQALDMFATMDPTTMNSAYSNALDALGEVVVKKLTQDELKSKDAIRSRFQMELRPFLASPSTNFLSCLGTYNFSCQTYQLVLEAFSNQSPLMDNNRKRAVFTHFIRPFLSRKDLPDPGCVSSADGSQLWLQANLGNFSAFATIEDLQTFNPNFSSAQALSELSPSQVAQLLLSSDISNDTKFIDRVFERLENGNAVDNVDEFFTKLTEQEEVPEFQADVRDRIMNKTYIIISPSFPEFTEQDFFGWFHVKLVPVLASFTPEMLRGVTTNMNCTNYHIIVSGMAKVVSAIPQQRLQEIADVLLEYLQDSAAVINQPDCRTGIKTDAQWIETNLGPFSPYITYSELKFFNLSLGALVNVLSPTQKAELIMDPDSGGLEDAILVKEVLTNLTESGDEEQLGQFFQVFTQILQQTNTTFILNAAVRETILNLTLNGLAPKFVSFEVEDYELWFQVYLVPVIASLHPDSLRVIPSNISCESYEAIVTGLMESLEFLPLGISMDVRASLESLQETFPDCAELDSFTCKETHVDEMLICWGVDSSQLQKTLEDNNSTSAVCNFTIIEHACTTPTNFTAGNLATLLTCSVESNKPYVVEVWQLLFHKASPILSQALDMPPPP